MKRTFVILFSMLYASLSTGLALNIHYCQGEIEDIFFAGQEEESSCCATTCCEKPEETKPSCCEDEVVLIQFSGEQVVTTQKFLEKESFDGITQSIVHSPAQAICQENNAALPKVSSSDSSPPLWLLHCNFTFYG